MTLQWQIHVFEHLSKPIEGAIPRVNPNVNSRLWVIMMCQGRFIIYNKFATWWGCWQWGRLCVCRDGEWLYFPLHFTVNLNKEVY